MDAYQRQNAIKVGDAIAFVLLDQLDLAAPKNTARLQDRFSYLIVVLSSLPQLMFSSKFALLKPHYQTKLICSSRLSGSFSLLDYCPSFFQEAQRTSSFTRTLHPFLRR
jgi:hypothetical protein